jgi:hypothetical protein
MKAGKRLRHRLGRPFRAWNEWVAVVPGRCPGLAWAAPLALKSDAPRGQTTLAQGNALALEFGHVGRTHGIQFKAIIANFVVIFVEPGRLWSSFITYKDS